MMLQWFSWKTQEDSSWFYLSMMGVSGEIQGYSKEVKRVSMDFKVYQVSFRVRFESSRTLKEWLKWTKMIQDCRKEVSRLLLKIKRGFQAYSKDVWRVFHGFLMDFSKKFKKSRRRICISIFIYFTVYRMHT